MAACTQTRSHSHSGKRPEAADPCHGGFGGGADRSVACFLASSTSQVETIISVIKAAARASVTYQPLVSLRHRRWVHALGWWCARQHQGDEGCKQFSVTSGGCLSECWCLHCVSGESAKTDGSQAPAKEVERKCVMNGVLIFCPLSFPVVCVWLTTRSAGEAS